MSHEYWIFALKRFYLALLFFFLDSWLSGCLCGRDVELHRHTNTFVFRNCVICFLPVDLFSNNTCHCSSVQSIGCFCTKKGSERILPISHLPPTPAATPSVPVSPTPNLPNFPLGSMWKNVNLRESTGKVWVCAEVIQRPKFWGSERSISFRCGRPKLNFVLL